MSEPLDLQLEVDIPSEWENAFDLAQARAVAAAVLRAEGISGAVAVDLSVVDDEEIEGLNARYRGVAAPTDVLSFPLRESAGEAGGFVEPPDGVLRLGDIVISLPRAMAQAEEYGHSLARECCYLLVHGLLHLLGYDHNTEPERQRMRAKEEAALAAVGLVR